MIAKDFLKTYCSALADLLERSGAQYSIQKEVVTVAEIAESDGLMVMFACLADSDMALSLGRPHSLILKASPTALLDFEVVGATIDLSVAYLIHFTAMRIDVLTKQAGVSKHINLDETYKEWHALLTNDYYLRLATDTQ